jgi:hypothetical protein
MLYYWQTKYTTSIYRPFFIFPHNRHFFVHISPSVLGVWKFAFCKISFQPSEDTDALISELPPLSQNFVHAADPSQIRKDGSRRVPDQGYRRGVEERISHRWQVMSVEKSVEWEFAGETDVLEENSISLLTWFLWGTNWICSLFA